MLTRRVPIAALLAFGVAFPLLGGCLEYLLRV